MTFVDTSVFHNYCSSTGCVISGEKLLFRQLFIMWSVLVWWQCCRKILSVLVCLSGNREGDQVFIVYL